MKTVRKQEALPQIPRRKRVAAYARVSSDKDAMKHSLSAQVSYYNGLIGKRPDWEFAGVYADDPTTGTKDTRPEFRRLLADCRAGKIDMVITKSVTRFARNTVTTLETTRELKTLGVEIYFEKEKVSSMSGDGELMLSILASYAQEESRSTSENIKWRLRHQFKDGRPNSTTIMGYKLVDGTFIIVPEEAEIVRVIFADYLSGMGTIAIAKKLDALGIPAKRGGRWNESTIHDLLRQEKLVGDLCLQKTFIEDHISKRQRINKGELPMYYVENSHEPIIDRETWGRVQDELARRAAIRSPSRRHTEPYPFTGKIVCALCGKHYRRKITGAGTPYEKAVWICATYSRRGKAACPSRQIPEEILISIVKGDFQQIYIPRSHTLVIVRPDGSEEEKYWRYKPRGESWTDEKRDAARRRRYEAMERPAIKCQAENQRNLKNF
jgi:DNA invertase Pin-like site-specific DNA recombinase